MPEAVTTTLGPELSQQEQEQLNLGLEALGLAQAGAAAAPSYGKYLGYVSLIRKWNKAMNLVSRQDVERFVTRHLLDSLSIAKLVTADPAARTVLDIGTGGGLPGIPLAIACPELNFTLADRSAKKIRFLSQVVRHLSLSNVQPVATDVAKLVPKALDNDAPSSDAPRYDVVVSRAVAPPQVLWNLARPLLAPEGRVVLQTQVREQDHNPEPDIGWADAQVTIEPHVVQVPGLQSVHQVLVLSQRNTR